MRIARPTRQQRCSREAVAIVRAQPIPWDRYRQIKRKFCTIVGGVLSPLIANLYMNRFLKYWRQTGRSEAWKAHVINYADDFVILSRGYAEEALAWTDRTMTRLGLTLNRTKTRLCEARTERFDFLGYSFGQHRFRQTGRRFIGASLSPKSVQRLKEKVGAILVPGKMGTWSDVRDTLNRLLRGWCGYFSPGSAP